MSQDPCIDGISRPTLDANPMPWEINYIDPGHNAKTFDGIRMHAPAIDLLVDQPKNCSQTINRAGEQTANELAIHVATIPRRRSTTSQDSQSMRHQQALDWGNQSIHANHMPHAYMGQSTLDPCHNVKLLMTSLNANPMPHACTVHATRYQSLAIHAAMPRCGPMNSLFMHARDQGQSIHPWQSHAACMHGPINLIMRRGNQSRELSIHATMPIPSSTTTNPILAADPCNDPRAINLIHAIGSAGQSIASGNQSHAPMP